MDDLVRDWKHVVFFSVLLCNWFGSFVSLSPLLLPNSMEEEGEKWSGIELIVVAKKFEANLIKVRDRRWSSKLRWYLRSQLLSLYQLLLREKKRGVSQAIIFFLVSYILLRENSVLPWPQNLPLLLDNFQWYWF